jgi:hypothetical protein
VADRCPQEVLEVLERLELSKGRVVLDQRRESMHGRIRREAGAPAAFQLRSVEEESVKNVFRVCELFELADLREFERDRAAWIARGAAQCGLIDEKPRLSHSHRHDWNTGRPGLRERRFDLGTSLPGRLALSVSMNEDQLGWLEPKRFLDPRAEGLWGLG